MLNTKKYGKPVQYITSLLLVIVVAFTCLLTVEFTGYRIVALVLLLTVSLLAMLFDTWPVLLAAVLSALTWNFLFIPPLYTFHVDNAEDGLMFLMYFAIALVNAVLTTQVRHAEKKAREKEEKENTIRLYNTLLNSLSHELRTPISTIIGAVDTLQENNSQLSEKNKSELLAEIDIAGMRLNRQVENLLHMSRLESGMLQLHKDWTDLPELVYQVIGKFRNISTHTILFFPADTLPLCKIDSGLMEQVLYNIIHNAVLYTPPGSVITITADCKNEKLVMEISDNGPGIPEGEIPQVFDKFYRVPETKTGGTGLGLSIARGFTEAHGGEIILENMPGSGARFNISVPVETTYLNKLKNE